MDEGVGATLREARIRRRIGLSEAEEATKIRTLFLSAIEAEEWEALPGDAYARGFVRAYAGFLGLDAARLAAAVPSHSPSPPAGGEERRGPSRRARVGLVCLGLVAVIAVVGLLWRGGGEGAPAVPEREPPAPAAVEPPATGQKSPAPRTMALSLRTTAELWVCLLDADGRALVDGVVLPPGAEEGPFRSGSFTVSLGNGEVEMRIDGRDTDIPESASPLGYEIGHGGDLARLGESERPTCT